VTRGQPWIVVSVHDVAPATRAVCQRQVSDLEDLGVRASLLVVPGPWREPLVADDPGFGEWLRACSLRGHEISQHGWDHRAGGTASLARRSVDRAAARGSAEFWALDQSEAARRLTWGRAVLESEGISPAGFTAPGWLTSSGTRSALVSLGYRYTTTHSAVIDLRSGTRHRAFAFCHRAGGRAERPGAMVLTAAVRLLPSLGAPVRVAMHPDDLARPRLNDEALLAIEEALARGARSLTYLEVLSAAMVTA
jgi:uncharacterized protein